MSDTRKRPPFAGDDRTLLTAFLDWQRQTMLWKLDGLSLAESQRVATPSGMNLLNMIKHLAYVEKAWFQGAFAGRAVYIPWRQGDPDGDFRIEAGDTVESIVEFYNRECAISREIVAGADLDQMSAREGVNRSLRWILIHMIEETARHVGHADLLRELTDGAVGE